MTASTSGNLRMIRTEFSMTRPGLTSAKMRD
jgi:hypothetical protein